MKYEELIALLKTAKTAEEIDARREEIAGLFPVVRVMFDYDQKSVAHQYDLWGHCLHTVIELERNIDDDMLYLAALLHDVGKPDCRVEGDAIGYYAGHPERAAEIIQERVLPTLPGMGVFLTKEEENRLLYYVKYHDESMELSAECVNKYLQEESVEVFKKLMMLHVADARAHILVPMMAKRVEVCSKLSGVYADELAKQILT